MDFLKKNWAKILIIIIALTSAVLMLIPVFMASKIEFFAACQTIGIISFFVGVAVKLALKMSDKTKNYAKFAMLGFSILVLIFMSIGLVGFNPKKDKAQGAFGNSYAIFKSVEGDITEGQAKIADGEAKIAALTPMATGLAGAAQAGAASLTLAQFELAPSATEAEQAQKVLMIASYVGAGFGDKATDTVAVAAAKVGTTISMATAQVVEGKAQLPTDIAATKKDANAGAMTILFTYIAMIIAFGMIPAIKATKKLVSKD